MWQTSNGITVRRLIGGRSNVYLVSDRQAAILVDTGWLPARSRLQARLDGLGFHNEARLTALVLTHAHFDHVENAVWIKERYMPKVLIQQKEADCLRGGSNALSQSPNALKRWMYARFSSLLLAHLHYQPVEADIPFNAGLDLSVWGIDARLLHTPGHTAGSSSLIVGERSPWSAIRCTTFFPTPPFRPSWTTPKRC